jgi:hypothetical protein
MYTNLMEHLMPASRILEENVVSAVPEFQISAVAMPFVIASLDVDKIERIALCSDHKTELAQSVISSQIHKMVGPERIATLVVAQIQSRFNPDMAHNAMTETSTDLDDLVFDFVGTSKVISNTVNNAGFQAQVSALVDAIGWVRVKQHLEEIMGIDIFPLAI